MGHGLKFRPSKNRFQICGKCQGFGAKVPTDACNRRLPVSQWVASISIATHLPADSHTPQASRERVAVAHQFDKDRNLRLRRSRSYSTFILALNTYEGVLLLECSGIRVAWACSRASFYARSWDASRYSHSRVPRSTRKRIPMIRVRDLSPVPPSPSLRIFAATVAFSKSN